MVESLVLIGVTCIIASVVGGGLKVARVAEIPLINSLFRQSLLAVVGVALIVGSFFVPQAQDHGDSRIGVAKGRSALTLSKASGPPGISLRVGGSGFAPGETVRIRFHVQEVAVARADSRGRFGGQTIIIPKDWPSDGQFEIIATGEQSGRSASQPFNVPAVAIELDPQSGRRGSQVRVSGSGFAVGEPVEIVLHLERLDKVKADGEGHFTAAVTIPSDWPFTGQFDIRATGETSRRTASGPFRVR